MFRPFRQRRAMRRMGQAMQGAFLESLNEANQLMAGGQYQQAAQHYLRLAQTAEQTGHPRQAANLHAQAARAEAFSHNGPAALTQGRLALSAFGQLGMLPRQASFLANFTNLLHKQGLDAEAESLQKEFGGPAPQGQANAQAPAAGQHGRLPPTCPQCGAPARSDEVDWIDAASAECAYCGAVIQTD